jgi:CubicO group peptidase (beta-lactamase class C family)
MKKSMLVAAFLLTIISANSQTWDDTVRSIEKIFERYKPSNPGTQVAISRNGKIIFSKAWGMADLEHNVPLTTTSPTEAGSVSKQFTAAAILLLEQQGKLSLNDDVRKYIPELPDYGYTITLAHMMHHTSGLKDWGSVAAIAGRPRSTVTYSNDDALLITSRQKTLNNKPGDEYIYSNTNYNLLAIIVARLSGMSFADFTEKNILQPAGMTHSQWRANFKKVVPDRAIAYTKTGNDYYTEMPNEYVHGNGGLLTTAEDLVAWTNFYTSGKLGSPSLFQKQVTTVPFNAGAVNRYAAGLFITSFKGKPVISHDGATAGYRCNLVHVEALDLTIAWLSNTAEFDRDRFSVAGALEDLFMGKQEGVGTVAAAPYTLSQEKMQNLTGWYKNMKSGRGAKMSVTDGNLTLAGVGKAAPVSDTEFAFGGARLLVLPNNKGLLWIGASRDSIYYSKVDAGSSDLTQLQEYVGEYYSEEAAATIHVVIKDKQPMLFIKPASYMSLSPTYKDGFDSPIGYISFERNKKGTTGFKVSQTRARNVSFNKIK